MKDAERFCLNAARIQLLVAYALLADNAEAANDIISSYKPTYNSIKEYFDSINEFFADKDAVKYDKYGNATVDF